MRWVLCVLLAGCGSCSTKRAAPPDAGRTFRKIDAHVHAPPAALPRLLRIMDERGIDVAVNLSGGWPGQGLEQSVEAARATNGRVIVFATPPIVPDGEALAQELEVARRLGARGVKLFKALGLVARDESGALIAVDDPRLDPLFDKAGELCMPVAIHTGDPIAFWQPATRENERFDELDAHPGWSYFEKPVPTWEALFAAYERRVARHPKTIFIGVHFGNAPEAPARVKAMLEKYPNLFVDTAARVPELGRRPAEVRELFLAFPDRVLFGTDLGVGVAPEDLMLGSTGLLPPTREDAHHFFASTWRFFESRDEAFAHPTPIQGRWTISGIGLPPDVLEKVYSRNFEERVFQCTR
jgi:predicted TIM-barrel fold metal-dependent hydrolase